ncbi:MAG: hypothetical protein QNJ20_03530 [Paracoccaceae bacterium]|nr:hypothetical protein [Paracoccaceae bacterium]
MVDLELMLVVAGGDPFAYRNKAVFAWLRKLARIGGVSGGAVVMANAGLLAHSVDIWERDPEGLSYRLHGIWPA